MSDQWAVSSNDALRLSLVASPLRPPSSATFAPTFTYPIYGEAETIYGYRNLSISLSFASASLRPCLRVDYAAKKNSQGVDIEDPAEAIVKFLPADELLRGEQGEEELRRIANDEASGGAWTPPGEKVHEYTVAATRHANGKGKAKASTSALSATASSSSSSSPSSGATRHFEVYRCKFSTPGFAQLHRRMQVFALLFIEAASYIEEVGSDSWEFFVLYERTTTPAPAAQGGPGGGAASADNKARYAYHFVGYTSLYSFWCMDASASSRATRASRSHASRHGGDGHAPTPSAEAPRRSDAAQPSRVRLSQFVVLPPYQGSGHGSALYATAYRAVLGRAGVRELTVEDPSEAFDRLRDAVDLRTLCKSPALAGTAEDGGGGGGNGGETDGGTGGAGRREAGRTSESFLALARAKGHLRAPIDAAWSERMRARYKVAPRQWARLMEMLQLLTLDEGDAEQVRAWRLQLKRRFYAKHRDVLRGMPRSERVAKLEQTFASVLDEYAELVGVDAEPLLALGPGHHGVDDEDDDEDEDGEEEGYGAGTASLRGLLRRVQKEEEDDDDDDEGEESRGTRGGRPSKRSRMG